MEALLRGWQPAVAYTGTGRFLPFETRSPARTLTIELAETRTVSDVLVI